MKTIVPLQNFFAKLLLLVLSLSSAQIVLAQAATGLVFNNPTRTSGTDLKKGAVYLFKSVITGVDATVTITDLVNGASVKKIDDNSGGLGYADAFQPEVQIGSKGESYALFTINFINATSGDPELLKSVAATSLDIDGSATLKEFSDINMNGGNATYMGTSLEIFLKNVPIVGTLLNAFRADNILGIEKTGIDTSAKGNMYTVNKADVSSFTVKYGAKSLNNSNSSRQYSLYMKGFQYPNQIMLPLNLLSFTATVNKVNTELKWTTASEKNVSHFAIEKSTDGKNFSDIATVFALGNTTEDAYYGYNDNLAASKSSVIYYRLRCIDNDGKYTYSEIRVIRAVSQAEDAKVMTYPNPFVSELRVTLPHNWQGRQATIELFNTTGQLVKSKSIVSASQTETISATELGRGFYTIRISSELATVQTKLIKN